MKLFWFSKINTKDSFSRISENVLPFLQKHYELYTIIPPTLVLSDHLRKLFKQVLIMECEENDLNTKIKYTIIQSLMCCEKEGIDIFFILMGVYESNFIMEVVNLMKLSKTKVIVYTPFDYIPSYKCIEHIRNCDLLITTIPSNIPIKHSVVGHGIDSEFKKLDIPRTKLINLINYKKFWYGQQIKNDEIIILNANLFSERKRIQDTINAFEEAVEYYKKIKLRLWLHGSYNDSLVISKKIANLIIVSNKVETQDLNLIYNVCQIGIQTSWGEGWSLTNCEHSFVGGLQIVPKWLACEYNFKNIAIFIDVEIKKSVNEAGYDTVIGIPINSGLKLIEGIKTLKTLKNNVRKYIGKTWENISYELHNVITLTK